MHGPQLYILRDDDLDMGEDYVEDVNMEGLEEPCEEMILDQFQKSFKKEVFNEYFRFLHSLLIRRKVEWEIG